MKTLTKTIPTTLVFTQGNEALTTSRIIAEHFGKEHHNVLKAMENLDCSEFFSHVNFNLAKYTDKQSKSRAMYNITKDGFMFLAMGFTGKKAAQWKEDFITEFNRMALILQQQQLDAKDQAMLKHIELLGQKDQEIADLTKRLPRRWTPTESKTAIECYFELGQRIRVIADRLGRTYNSTQKFLRRVRKAMEEEIV